MGFYDTIFNNGMEVDIHNRTIINEDYINRWKFFQYCFDSLLAPIRNSWLYWYCLVYILHKKKARDKYFFYLVSLHYGFNAFGDFINSTFNFYDLTYGFSSIIPRDYSESDELKKKLKYTYYLVTVPAVIFWYLSKIIVDSYYFLKFIRYCNNNKLILLQSLVYLVLVFSRIMIPSYYITHYDYCTYEKKLGYLASRTLESKSCTNDPFWNKWWNFQVFTEGVYIIFYFITYLVLHRSKAKLIHDLMVVRSDVTHKSTTNYNHTEYIDDIKHTYIHCFRYDSQFRICIGSLFSIITSIFYGFFVYSFFTENKKTMECLRYFFINLSISIIYIDQILQSKVDDAKSARSYSFGHVTSVNKYTYNFNYSKSLMDSTTMNSINNFEFSGKKPQQTFASMTMSMNSIKGDYDDDFITSSLNRNNMAMSAAPSMTNSIANGSIVGVGNGGMASSSNAGFNSGIPTDRSLPNGMKKPSPVANIVMDTKFMENYDEMNHNKSPVANINTTIYNNNTPSIEKSSQISRYNGAVDDDGEASNYLLNLSPRVKGSFDNNKYFKEELRRLKLKESFSSGHSKLSIPNPKIEEGYVMESPVSATSPYSNRFKKYNHDENKPKSSFNYNGGGNNF